MKKIKRVKDEKNKRVKVNILINFIICLKMKKKELK